MNGGIFRFQHHLASTRYDSESCALEPKEAEVVMLKVVAEAKEASMKKRRLSSIEKFDDSKVNRWIPLIVRVWCSKIKERINLVMVFMLSF